MKTIGLPINTFIPAGDIHDLAAFRQGLWQHFRPEEPVAHSFRGKTFRLRPGLTFTPFANPVSCNAHCTFCSEELLRRDAGRLSARMLIRDYDTYFEALEAVLKDLQGFPAGLSLSGLEATAEPRWMLRLLQLLQEHPAMFPEKVLYTNGSGLYAHPDLVEALVNCAFDRLELSRCHFDEAVNQGIMRFNRNQAVWRRAAFEELIGRLKGKIHVKLSCLLSLEGVRDSEGIEAYLRDAQAAGADSVVFRELSLLGEAYTENRETQWIRQNRVSVNAVMQHIQTDAGKIREGWRFEGATAGYYYYNESYSYAGMPVRFETSSYPALRQANASGVVQKLIFHSNGNLCGDWDPDAHVLASYLELA